MYGWIGKVLRVDLTKGELKEESLDPKVAKYYIGGRVFGIYYLLKEQHLNSILSRPRTCWLWLYACFQITDFSGGLWRSLE